jgi:CRP-like cAMP-binding protein
MSSDIPPDNKKRSGDAMVEIRNRVLRSLRPAALEFIEKRLVTRPIASGEVIYEEGDPAAHAIFPHEGRLSLMAVMESGRSVEKMSIGNEGFLGLGLVLGGGALTNRSVVRVPGYASWLSVADLDEAIAEFECVTPAMLRYAKALIVQLMESVACNSLHAADQRVARWLLHAVDSVPGDSLEVTQQAIAESLGFRRATVNQVCASFMEAGLIGQSRGNILIRDRFALEARACECYRRIRGASLADPGRPSEPESRPAFKAVAAG